MHYILWLLAAVLAVLKIVGTITLSWWIITGIALVPVVIGIVVFLIAFGATLYLR
ncbi:hypothetical protein [Agrobacterium sp. CFBP2214]|uniref:hypothetical protein n=1 Tax=Agrobacterium sp. CFBP2214 TaxID=3040274 RepID=UPI00254E36A6|nr:hypothetical protein [Agrobacterium sp. CFBP2214]